MRKLKSAGDTTREPGGRSSAGTSVEPHSVLDLSGASHLLVRCSRAGRSTRVERQVGAHSAEHAEHAEHARGIRGAQSVDRAVDACGEPTMMPALFDLRYEGGIIQEMGSLEPRPGERVIDLDGAYLCAGLVDAHVHLALGGASVTAPPPPTARRVAASPESAEALTREAVVAANGANHLAHGVTAVRDLGGYTSVAPAARGGTRPLVVSSAGALTRRGHYGAFLGFALGVDDDPAQAVRDRVAGGAGVVKVILTGSVDLERGVAPPAHFHSEELRRMVETAHELGVAVAVHANGAQAVTMAAEAGVDSVEHGILIDEESVRAMVDHDVVWVPTLTPLHALAVSGRWAAVPRIIAAHEAMVAAGHAAGVRIAAGTDAGSPGVAHGAVLSEVAHLRSAGLSPEAARAAVGAVAADLLGLGGGYGRLSRGAATDLVWFKQDPFADPSPDNARAPRPLGVLSSPRPTASVGARMR